MTKSMWHVEECGASREYMLGHQPQPKYQEQDEAIKVITEVISEFLHIEPAIRLMLDSPQCNPERAVLSLPVDCNIDQIMKNFASQIYLSLSGYYLGAEPKSTHFGISNIVLEGKANSLLRREVEKLCLQFRNRPDIAARLLTGVEIKANRELETPKNNFLQETIGKALNIYVGFRIYAFGEQINSSQLFIPMEASEDVISIVYANIEQVIAQNFLGYDEQGDGYLKITETLVFRELESLLKRLKNKQITRQKVLNNLQSNAVYLEDASEAMVHDALYDLLNQVSEDRLKNAASDSHQLNRATQLRSAELTAMHQDGAPAPKAKKVPAKKAAPKKAAAKTEDKVEAEVKVEAKVETKAKVEAASKTEEPAETRTKVPEPPKEKTKVPSGAEDKEKS